jgi:radical SAM/SPASM domain protein of ACGX system
MLFPEENRNEVPESMEYFAFQWHITEACDQRCRHCYIYALGSHAQFQEMAVKDMLTVIENIQTFCRKAKRLPYIYLTGGDPILHPQFWTLVRMLKTANIPFAILGNPFHLTPEVCTKLHDYGCRKYQLSLDGLRETHDRIRRPGSYDETLTAIPYLRESRIDSAVMATVSRWNYQDIPSLVDVVVENKADIFAFARYCPSMADRDSCCSPEEYHDMMEQCWKKFEQYRGCSTTFNLKDHLWTLFLYEKGLFTPSDYPDDNFVYEGCNCGNCHLTILSDGSVYACRRMESNVGNALTTDLHDLFTGQEMDLYRTYENFEKCRKCELLRFCRGCPAVAAGYSGNLYAPDPQCWKEIG